MFPVCRWLDKEFCYFYGGNLGDLERHGGRSLRIYAWLDISAARGHRAGSATVLVTFGVYQK